MRLWVLQRKCEARANERRRNTTACIRHDSPSTVAKQALETRLGGQILERITMSDISHFLQPHTRAQERR
jgi:hypothetical protein